MDRSEVKDHRVHLKKLIKNAEANNPEAVKELVDYLMLSKASEHSEIIL